MTKLSLFATLLITIILLCSTAVKAQNVSLTITGIKNNKGQMVVSVFKDEQSFKDTKPVKSFKFPKAGVVSGVLKVGITLESGTYGLAMLDDEDSNGEMKNNIFKIPKEGFGFSNFYLSGMSRPSFNNFKFEVKKAPVRLESKIRYL